jgi:hypothetical protein
VSCVGLHRSKSVTKQFQNRWILTVNLFIFRLHGDSASSVNVWKGLENYHYY